MSKKHKKRIVKAGLPPETLVYTGDRAKTPPVVHTIAYNPDFCNIFETYLPEKAAPDRKLWVDVLNISDVNFIKTVGEQFNIHPLAQEDVVNTQQRAKMDEYDNGLFIVLPNIRYNERWVELQFEQVSMFVGQDILVTFQEDPDDTLQLVRQRLGEASNRMRKKGTDYLAYSVMDSIIDNYFVALDKIETSVFEVENSIYAASNQHFKAKIFSLKHTLSQFKNKVQPLREAVARMHRTDCPILRQEDAVYLRDIADHVAQVLDHIDNFKDQLINIESLYQSEISNRMNNVMKLLTVISTIFIPLSFVAGVYGMNFENMPELKWHYGYFLVLGFMFITMVGMLIYFRVKKMI